MSTFQFKGVSNYGYAELNEQLEDNYTEWLKYNLLNIGAYENVRIASSGHYGGDKSVLRPVKDTRYGATSTSTKIWEGFRGDWVWESGVTNTINISGIYINNVFHSATSSPAYTIDYPRGRIIFNNALPIASSVSCEFAYRYVTCGKSSLPWARRVLLNAYRVDLPDNYLFGSGRLLTDNNITLPALIVEAAPRRSYSEYQIGGGQYVYQDMIFHIFAESTFDRNQLIDILTHQSDSTIQLFDRNLVAQANQYPLRYDGSLLNSQYNFPYLVNNYFYNKSVIKDVGVSEISSNGVFNAVVKYTVEVIRPDIA